MATIANANSALISVAATSLTVPITLGSGTNRKIVCAVVSETGFTLNALTFDGTTFLANNIVDRDNSGTSSIRVRLFYYDVPDIKAAASYDVALTLSSSTTNYSAHVWQLVDALPGTAESSASATNGSGTTLASGNVTATASAALVAIAASSSPTGPLSFSGDVVERSELNEANFTSAGADAGAVGAGTKTTTMTDGANGVPRVIALASFANVTGPTITVQPANDVGIISNGDSTVYTTTATGTTISALTWSEDGTPIADGGIYDISTTGIGTGSVTSTLTITRTDKTGTPWDIKANVVDANGNTDTNTVTDTWWTGPVLTTFPATNGSGVSTATLTCDYVTGVGEAIEVRIPLSDGDVAVTVTTT